MSSHIDLAQAVELIQNNGYKAKLEEGEKTAVIESAANGLGFRIIFFNPEPEDSNQYTTYQIECGYNIPDHVNLNKLLVVCNQFNNQYRFLKTVVAKYDDFAVILKMDCAAFSSNIDDFNINVGIFIHCMSEFSKFVMENEVFQNHGYVEKHNAAFGASETSTKGDVDVLQNYAISAHGGFAGSQNNLGDMYEKGELVEKSLLYAAYWYTRAAERGESFGYANLALLLSSNSSDTQVLIDAAKFACLAQHHLDGGDLHQKTLKCLDELSVKLSEEELKIAAELASRWEPLYHERQLISDDLSVAGNEADGGKTIH